MVNHEFEQTSKLARVQYKAELLFGGGRRGCAMLCMLHLCDFEMDRIGCLPDRVCLLNQTSERRLQIAQVSFVYLCTWDSIYCNAEITDTSRSPRCTNDVGGSCVS